MLAVNLVAITVGTFFFLNLKSFASIELKKENAKHFFFYTGGPANGTWTCVSIADRQQTFLTFIESRTLDFFSPRHSVL